MPMYGIRDRSPFVQYQTALTQTKQGASTLDTGQKRYYSSIDAEIYFGSYYIDEVVQITYQVQQNTMPLFGYNDYLFHEMALGNRIVSGQFSINFTRPGYLFDMLTALATETISSSEEQVELEEDGLDTSEATEGITSKDGSNRFTTADYQEIPRGRRPLFHTGFDIDIMFGQEDYLNPSKHVLLEGVYLTGSNIGIDTSGAPIIETYSFIARDIIPIE